MNSFSIGLSGLDVAQKAIEITGNNIANAATEGYHRQRVDLSPAYASQLGSVLIGGGVEFNGVSRMIDNLLEQEILRQQSSLGQTSQELDSLNTVETTFGEFSSGDDSGCLNAMIDKFFSALQDLSAHTGEIVWQKQVLSVADTMVSKFRTLGQFLSTLEDQVMHEAQTVVDQVNVLTGQISELNDKIEHIELTGAKANNLRDQRDQYVTELAKLIGVETIEKEYGVVDVVAADIPVVTGSTSTELEVGLDSNGKFGVTPAGAYNYNPDVQGGRLAGLLALKNELIGDAHDKLDTLAQGIIRQINQYHFQGLGSDGSFTELTGWTMPSENLSDYDNPPVTDGKIYIRVIDTATGEITRHEINIDASSDTLASIAAEIDALDGLSASVASSKLHIQADTGYTFDFLPAVLPEPTDSNLTGTSPPSISVAGVYTGTENQTFTFTVQGTGSVGNGDLKIEVKNGAGKVVTTLNVGEGYAAGDLLTVGDGIKISLGRGNLNNGDTFEIDVFGSTDTSGLLAATGINAFFAGNSASNIEVSSDIADNPGRIATALGADMTDNINALRLAGLKDQAISDLDDMTPGEFYRRLVTDLGRQISVKQMQQDSTEAVIQNLANQQSEISGVDINDEAAQLLVLEQMFQAMAKYIASVQSTISTIMDMI
jgi:flagellar hook-associated protein FlgK